MTVSSHAHTVVQSSTARTRLARTFVTFGLTRQLEVSFCNWQHLSAWASLGEPEFEDMYSVDEDDDYSFFDYVRENLFGEPTNLLMFVGFIVWSALAAYGVYALLA